LGENQAVVRINRRAEERLARGHPWIFRSDIVDSGHAAPGSVVGILGSRQTPLGHALFSSESEITLRVLTRGHERFSSIEELLAERLEAAIRWRDVVAPGAGACCRLVHGEGDGLPALIVDRYADVLVVQLLCQGMEALKELIVRELVLRFAPRGILARNDPRVRTLEGLPRGVELLHGEVPSEVEVAENGVHLAVDVWRGQKTGLFLDQRENHLMAREYVRGKTLDGFSYNGGFALAAAERAETVHAIDVSEDAVARLRENARRNQLANVTAEAANVFDVLHALDDRHERFDSVILDPPAFAKSRAAVAQAWRGYKEINLRALKILGRGGCLITCSCSYHISEYDFEGLLQEAAEDAGATVVVVERRRQARDHPILLAAPETRYLKCLVLRRLA
jgi:23S rRNA (cytosine1962-C5)-methyltransferase